MVVLDAATRAAVNAGKGTVAWELEDIDPMEHAEFDQEDMLRANQVGMTQVRGRLVPNPPGGAGQGPRDEHQGGPMTDSQTVVKALVEVDPGFTQLCETLFGKAVDAAEVWEWLYTPEGWPR